MRPADESFGFDEKGIECIVLDSRKDMKNGLFVPIIGEKSDGHDYIEMAIRHGAAAVLSSRPVQALSEQYPHVRFYQVRDTRLALQEIGLMQRRKFEGTVIGVTGSVGKTTTRAMLACALSAEKKVFQTAGNANSQVGVPITMFEMARSGAELAVIELGMSEPGEMSRIAQVACVDMAVMTNIGIAHIGQLKTQENILREKLHILDGSAPGVRLFLNSEDSILSSVSEERIRELLGRVPEGLTLSFYGKRYYGVRRDIPALSVRGEHMLQNAEAALAVSRALGLSPERAAEALARFRGLPGRGEIFCTKDGITVIDDAYNASPDSMRAGLSVLAGQEGKRRIAVLADMRELGEEAPRYHRELGVFLSDLPIDAVFLYGELAQEIGTGIRGRKSCGRSISVLSFSELSGLRDALWEAVREGDVLLFKGSLSMNLSSIVDEFRGR